VACDDGPVADRPLTCSVRACAHSAGAYWVKVVVDEWVAVACIEDGLIFRSVTRSGTMWGSGISEKVVWWVVGQAAQNAAIEKVAPPHDLRRTCARLCHSAGGELEQIRFLLGHRSVETTERYLGSRQRIVHAVNVGGAVPGPWKMARARLHPAICELLLDEVRLQIFGDVGSASANVGKASSRPTPQLATHSKRFK
jgi:hypothetical protein